VNVELRTVFATGAWAIAVCSACTLQAAPDPATLQTRYHELSRQFAVANPDWRPVPPRTGTLLFIASDQYSPARPTAETMRPARNKYADALFELAQQAAEAGQLSLAFQWTTETLRENPDHAAARRVLGYVEKGGKWLTPYGAKMHDAGKMWDSQKGWLAINAAATAIPDARIDAARHTDIKNGWQVRTDHFLVTTNHSLAAGAELAARIERLYQIWRQLFAGFYYSEQEVKGLFAGERIARVSVRQFKVFYHRNREDYVNTLSRRQPRIAETLGIYFDTNAEAHFFAEESTNDKPASSGEPAADVQVATLYHEAVHQLFQESKPAARRIGELSNFWVIEGVATYFETLTEHNDAKAGLYYTIGEFSAGRLPKARERLHDNYYVPLADLTKLGKDEMQGRDDVAKLYSQSSGLAAFLLNGAEGRYREALVRYLQAVYTRHDNDQTLAEATGSSYPELDAAYRRFMESLP
jgi:lysophospholipase L1-like esterase